MARRFLVACVQMHSTNQLILNLERVRLRLKEAVERGAELVMLPEDFAFLAEKEEEKRELSLGDLRRIEDTLREEAIRHSIHLLAGGYPERLESGKLANKSTLFSPKGEEIASYRKLHLFDADPPGAVPIRESTHIEAGSSIVVARTALCSIGLSICYDLRFPELYRSLALAGAELLTVPAAFTLTTGKDHWQVLLQARAIENQCYLAAPAQWGKHSSTRHSFGRSLICDPWGTILACASEGEGLALAEIDLSYLQRVRQIVPCHQHIRRDLFPFASLASPASPSKEPR